MINIINEFPAADLHGGQLYAINNFLDPKDLTGKDVLDIGCGFGWFERHAIKQDIKKIIAMDHTDEDLKTIRKFILDPRVDFSVGSAIALPFPDNSFDTVVTWEVLEHIPKRTEVQMFREMKRVLRPEGRIYLSTPHHSFITNLLDPAYLLTGHRHYKPRMIEKFAEEAQLTVENMTVKGGFLDSIFVLNLYIAKWIFRRRPFFENFFNKSADRRYTSSKNGKFQLFAALRLTKKV
jgi:2-polyprenyl-3-methyl-5-hydroxy-6-metoxy-1,4-benzoquinol methylase